MKITLNTNIVDLHTWLEPTATVTNVKVKNLLPALKEFVRQMELRPNGSNHRQADGLPTDCPRGLES